MPKDPKIDDPERVAEDRFVEKEPEKFMTIYEVNEEGDLEPVSREQNR